MSTPHPAELLTAYLSLALLLLFGASRLFGWWYARYRAAPPARQPTRPPLPTAPEREQAAAAQPAALRPAAVATWLQVVNDQPETPHTLIVGPTRAGKTTIAGAIAATRPGRVAILDPKWRPGKWGDAPATPIDDDGGFIELELACSALLGELQQRLAALKRGQLAFEPLTIIVEELPALVKECPSAARLFLRIGQLGAELELRLVGISQSERVKSLGIEGEGDARANFCFVRVGDTAATVVPEAQRMARPAVLTWRGQHFPIDTTGLDVLARRPIDPARWWVVRDTPADEPAQVVEAELSRLLSQVEGGTSLVTASGRADFAGIPPVTSDVPAPVPADGLDDDVIRTLHLAGWSRNRIAAKMQRGNKQQRLERIRRALDMTSILDEPG